MNITQNSHAARLLILDEDDLTLRFLADNLTADNYATSTAATARAARILLERDPVDLLVVDVNGDTLRLLDSIRHARSRLQPGPAGDRAGRPQRRASPHAAA